MKFEKMQNGTLRCILNKEDLDSNGIGLEDFFTNTQNARDFLEKLIRIAEDEVGFKASSNMMSIQAAVLSENEIVLTFSENQMNGSDIIDHLRSIVSGLKEKQRQRVEAPDIQGEILKEVEGTLRQKKEEREKAEPQPVEWEKIKRPQLVQPGQENMDNKNSKVENTEEINEEKEREAKGSQDANEKEKQDYCYLLTFDSLSQVIKYAAILPKADAAFSMLYHVKNPEGYYLWVDLNSQPKQYIYEFVAGAMEYASEIEKESAKLSFLNEHGTVICKVDALATLAGL